MRTDDLISHGEQWSESRRGSSGHEHNPFFARAAPRADEEHGEVYAFSRLRLRGLDQTRDYQVREVHWNAKPGQPNSEPSFEACAETNIGGDVLCHAGLHLPHRGGDFFARMWHLRAPAGEP